jgi:hypothetical protein
MMAGDNENGSIIGVFPDRDTAKDWLERMVTHLIKDGLYIKDTELTEVNLRWRAGVVFEKEQLEFDFDN